MHTSIQLHTKYQHHDVVLEVILALCLAYCILKLFIERSQLVTSDHIRTLRPEIQRTLAAELTILDHEMDLNTEQFILYKQYKHKIGKQSSNKQMISLCC